MATAAIGTGVSLGLSALSGALTPTKTTFNETQVGKLEDVSTRKTGAGWSLGKPFGRVQIKGCPIFWAPQRREEVVTTTETSTSGGSKFGGGQRTVNTTQTYKYFGTFAFAICDGAAGIDVRQIKFNDTIWYNKDGALSSTVADNDYKLENYLKIYSGASNQTIDPTIQNYEGNQNGDRNFKHLCYAVVTDLPLDEFGGELPGTIDVVVLRDATTGAEPYNRIDKVIYEVAESVGLVRNVDIKCDGLLTSATNGSVNLRINALFKQDGQTAAEFINEIVQRHFLLSYLDADGAIVFELPENATATVNTNFNQLGATDYGSEPGDPYDEIMPDISELPSSVTLNFSNVNDDFNGDNEVANYPIATHYNPKSINSQLYLTTDDAKWWTWKYLQFAWSWARRFTVNLLPEDAINLTEGFRLAVPLVDGESAITFQVASVVYGANYVGEIELYVYDGSFFTAQPSVSKQLNTAYNGGTIQLSPNINGTVTIVSQDGLTTYVEGVDYSVNATTGVVTILPGSGITSGDNITIFYNSEPDYTINPVNPNNEQPDYGEPVITVVETNRIRPGDNPCIYAAIARGGNNFGVTTIYGRLDGGSYQALTTVLLPTAKGTLSGTLALASGLDEVNTATVVMTEGILESISQSQFDNQEIILLIGDEQIVARDVTLVSPNTYELSYLQRGVNGTPPVAHADSETVYIAKGTNDSLAIIPIDATLIGQNIDLKAVPNNVTLADVLTVTSHTIQGIYYKPYAPSNATATKDSAGNITTINWDGNNTGLNELFPQSYEIDIYNGINIVRTISTGEKTTSYLIDDQIADFGSIQSTITIAIYQLSTEFGRGYVYDVVLDPVLADPIPTITGFSPTQGDIGDAITIYGTGFTSATSAAINGTNITTFVVIDDNTITGNVDAGTTTGKITVTNPIGTGESMADFVIVDLITDWGDIGGILSNQADLWDYLKRSWRYAYTLQPITIPSRGSSVAVDVSDPSYFMLSQPITIKDGSSYCQFIATDITGNTLTLQRSQKHSAIGTTIQANAFVVAGFTKIDLYEIDTFGSVYIEAPTNSTVIKIPAGVGYTINAIKGVAVDTGSCTLAIKINGVAVTGLSAIAVTSTPQNVTATGANIVADGDLLTYEFSSVVTAQGFRGSLYVAL